MGTGMMDQVAYITAGVLIFCAVLALLSAELSAWRSALSKNLRKVLGLPMLVMYVYAVLLETILGRRVADEPKAALELFWSHRESLSVEGGSLVVTDAELFAEILLNILLFVPLGALLPFLFPRQLGEGGVFRGGAVVCVVACVCSFAIELSQLHFNLGLFEFDDVLHNTLGALLGYALFRLITWVAARRFPAAG